MGAPAMGLLCASRASADSPCRGEAAWRKTGEAAAGGSKGDQRGPGWRPETAPPFPATGLFGAGLPPVFPEGFSDPAGLEAFPLPLFGLACSALLLGGRIPFAPGTGGLAGGAAMGTITAAGEACPISKYDPSSGEGSGVAVELGRGSGGVGMWMRAPRSRGGMAPVTPPCSIKGGALSSTSG